MSPLLCPVADLMQTRILRCPANESLGVALERMQAARVGSILIDCADASQGILTRTDLIDRVILPRTDLGCAVSTVMSHPVRTLPVESSVLDALEAMMRWRVRHLPLVSAGEIVGLLSEHDLMRQLRNSPDRLMLSIERAHDQDSLIAAAGEAAGVARQLHREALPALQIARIMSLLNDALTRQAIACVASGLGTHADAATANQVPQRWAWIALGSEARAEQTVVTDQDNALILADPLPGSGDLAEALPQGVDQDRVVGQEKELDQDRVVGQEKEWDQETRVERNRKVELEQEGQHAAEGSGRDPASWDTEQAARLFAERVNILLDRMGFPLCKGGVMAMNSAWCKTLGGWTREMQGWVARPHPEAILKASTALDFRWLAGDRSLVQQLEERACALFEGARDHRQMQPRAVAARGFLRALAGSILERNIQPIPSEGMLALRQWIGGLGGETQTTPVLHRDLKLHGTSLIVDAVRFLALAHVGAHQWMPHSTVDRIRWLEKGAVLQEGESAALLDAFEALTALRLEGQLARSPEGDAHDANRVDLLALNSNQRRMLRHHLHALSMLRDKVRMDFGG